MSHEALLYAYATARSYFTWLVVIILMGREAVDENGWGEGRVQENNTDDNNTGGDHVIKGNDDRILYSWYIKANDEQYTASLWVRVQRVPRGCNIYLDACVQWHEAFARRGQINYVVRRSLCHRPIPVSYQWSHCARWELSCGNT